MTIEVTDELARELVYAVRNGTNEANCIGRVRAVLEAALRPATAPSPPRRVGPSVASYALWGVTVLVSVLYAVTRESTFSTMTCLAVGATIGRALSGAR